MTAFITLIPDSGIQFWDIDIDFDALPRRTRPFWEERTSDIPDETGHFPVMLHELTEDEHGVRTDRNGRNPPPQETYDLGRKQAVEMVLDRFVPVPYFLVIGTGNNRREVFDRGPSNWVRMRLSTLAESAAGRTHRLTLVFDTALLARVGKDATYLGPSPENSERQQEFAFVATSDANSWFLNEAWVGEWLRDLLLGFRASLRPGRALRKEDMPSPCEHYARYLVLLELLDELSLLPRIKLLDVVSRQLGYVPVAVDLVLDIGNARTCGILIEEHPGEALNLSNSYPLALRDLSMPERLHVRPFDSRVEFSRPSFGSEAISRRSGRASAFAWPSPVRVGPEAVRLAGEGIGTGGSTGLSSPKRYLWDDRPSPQGWRFNGRASDGITTDPPVSGPFMAQVTEEGNFIGQRGAGTPAARARFSRSAIFAFMLAEILLQALNQMNAPGNRQRQRDADKPRRLRSVQMTMPPGMPVAEQRILKRRAQDAVRLAWAMLGWTGKMPEPVVKVDLDEASATQIVWLHNEVSERLQGDAGGLVEMLGRIRPDVGLQPCLRVASIDIGGGTTDLMVTTYTLAGEAIVPRQEFRESFKIAGDDVLERIITRVILPAFAQALAAAGIDDPQALLSRTLGQDQGGQDQQKRHLRRLFVSQVLEPIGIAVLQAYERVEGRNAGEVLRASVGGVLGADLVAARRALMYLEEAAVAAGAARFSVADIVILADTGRIEPVVIGVLGPVLADLCEVTWSYDCDVLLLSGRPSRMRVVTDIVLAKAPVPPHRLIGMHRYRVGERYPFRDAANRIDDPKTTAAVGAALCVQAEGRLRNFTLRTRNLAMRSTARIIGRMDNNGQIRDSNVLLADLNLDAPPNEDAGFTVAFQATTQIGFRQLPIERWTATPLYVMEFANPDNARTLDLPLNVTVRRTPGREDDIDELARETFRVEEVVDAGGAGQPERVVRLRLQTLDDQDGYWRDTGRLSLI